jgi:hypothetical protein
VRAGEAASAERLALDEQLPSGLAAHFRRLARNMMKLMGEQYQHKAMDDIKNARRMVAEVDSSSARIVRMKAKRVRMRSLAYKLRTGGSSAERHANATVASALVKRCCKCLTLPCRLPIAFGITQLSSSIVRSRVSLLLLSQYVRCAQSNQSLVSAIHHTSGSKVQKELH